MSCDGGHLGFPISIKNRNLVKDIPMTIHLQFGFSQFISFREEDLWNFSQSEHEVNLITRLGVIALFHHCLAHLTQRAMWGIAIVRRPSVNFFIFSSPGPKVISFREEDLWNFSQSEHIIGLDSHIEYPTGTKNSNFMPSSQKLQIWLKPNCTWMFIRWPSTNLSFFVPVWNSKWRLRQDLV
jgi:hypothetical protein